MILALQTADHTTRLWLVPAATADLSPSTAPQLEWQSGRGLAEGLLRTITELLAAHQQSLSSLRGIIIFSGPGSFTSLRIGHATANALADGLGIPVVGTQGEHWLNQGLQALAHTPAGHPALPHYGSEAHITMPRR